MSVPCVMGDMSNVDFRPWLITVITILVIVWRPMADVANAYAGAVSVAALAGAACGTAAKYSNRSNR